MVIGEILVEDEVATAQFSCDLGRCRGACCTLEGGRGAPLLDEERGLVEAAVPVVLERLPARSIAEIGRRGAVDGVKGAYATTCVDDRDCVFVVYDGPVAKCAIEDAFNRGELPWRKPVSCHLFPLRFSRNGAGLLRYEAIPECAPGREKGRAGGIPVTSFLREALDRRFGTEWRGELDRAAGRRREELRTGEGVGAATGAGK